ncbi:hypothetical protein B9Z55_003322 [Caenorhabditis nigoni]|uniref:IBB domain-containing protein n=2 Tax=Caenorhabditis nigoni TaxID=1611254 RepID=A0A2G5VPQ4_9PELO|nr:hypothetical protein B9Z55_003322 [Caenorhabditis nigoni]
MSFNPSKSSIFSGIFPKMFLIYLGISTVILSAPTIFSALDGPVDTVDITGFSKCSSTSRWFRTQFLPFLKEFQQLPRGLIITYHPLSIGSGTNNGSKYATCENGWLECQLNKLQCCSKKYMQNQNPTILLTTVACIQGKDTVDQALQCLAGNSKNLIQKCANNAEGEALLLAEPFPHNDSIALPWIKINGIRSYEATKQFKTVKSATKLTKMSLSETKLARDNADDGKDDAGRLQQYKNLTKHEELRRRRTECSVEIRKQKGADLMMKRRNIIDNEDDLDECESENEGTDKGDKLSNQQMSNTNRLSNDEIKQILSANPSEDDMIRCFESLRKSLSKTKNPPIDDVIQSGLINALVQALRVQNDRVQYEAAWALTNIVSGTTSQTMSAVEAGACAPLVELSCHSDGQIAEQALWAVANIAGDSAQLRDYVNECHGVEALMHLMSRIDQFTTSHVRTIAWAFSNMCRHKNPHAPLPVLKVLAKGLAVLVKHSDRQVRQDACWAVSYLTDGPDEQIELARESGVLSTIVSYLDESENLIAPALRTLGNVATGNDSLTQSVIDLGVLDRMVQLMEKTRSTSIMKECCWLISNIIAGTQKQIQAVLDAHLLPILVNILKSGDHKCQFEASWALSNLAQGGTSRQIVAMMEENAVPALCQALNTTHNQDMLNNTLETLYTLMLTVQTSYSHKMDILHDEVEENGGLDALERLQESQSESIYTQAYRIITQFFGDDENDQNDENSRASAAGNAQNQWNF